MLNRVANLEFSDFSKMADREAARGVGKLRIEEKAAIVALHKDGMSADLIAKRVGRHRASIFRLLNNAKGLPKFTVPKRKTGTGRPRIMSKFLVDVLKRQITKYPMMTAADLRNSVPELQVVSERTIQRTLQKMLKMPSRTAAQKPLLTEKMKKKRLQFAKNYQHFT